MITSTYYHPHVRFLSQMICLPLALQASDTPLSHTQSLSLSLSSYTSRTCSSNFLVSTFNFQRVLGIISFSVYFLLCVNTKINLILHNSELRESMSPLQKKKKKRSNGTSIYYMDNEHGLSIDFFFFFSHHRTITSVRLEN